MPCVFCPHSLLAAVPEVDGRDGDAEESGGKEEGDAGNAVGTAEDEGDERDGEWRDRQEGSE